MFSFALKDYVATKLYCENNPFAQRVLEHRMATGDLHKAPIAADVRQLKGQDLQQRRINFVMAGFPCQGFSVMGAHAGFSDERSKLGLEIFRLLRESKGYVVGVLLENVPNKALVEALCRYIPTGYGIKQVHVSGENTGAKIRRKRWFAIIYKKDKWRALQRCFPTTMPKIPRAKEPVKWQVRELRQFPKDYKSKFHCLGNTINPVAIQTAIVTLMHDAKLPDKANPTHIKLKQGSLTFIRSYWPSPKTTTSLCATLSARNSKTLDGALQFELHTTKFIKEHNLHPNQILPSIPWILYLLQIPQHWMNLP